MRLHTVSLSTLCKGGGSYGIAASAVEYSASLPTYLRITDINDDGTLNFDGLKSVADPNASKYYLAPNDIVFARTGASTGRNYFYDGTDGSFVYAGFLIKFSIDPQKINPLFIKYYCQSKDYYTWVASFNTGSTRGNMNAVTLGNMPIPAIPKEQQDLLAATLSALDAKIANNTAMNRCLEQMAQAIFSDTFGFVLHGNVPMGEFLRFANGFAFKSSTYLDTGRYKIITIKNVQDGSVDSAGASCLDELPTGFNSSCMLAFGDVLLSLTGNVGRVGIVTEDNLLLNQRVAKFDPINQKLLPFWYFLFRQTEMKDYLFSIAKGTAQQNLSPIETLKTKIFFDETTAAKYAGSAAALFWKIAENRRESKRLATLRDTLLPRLMSGELTI